MGIFIGILNFIPYMQALGIIPLGLASLLMAAQTGENAFVCMLLAYGVLMVVQIIQDMIIVPRIMGQTMGMRPSLILWSYLSGATSWASSGCSLHCPLLCSSTRCTCATSFKMRSTSSRCASREEKRKAKQSRRKKRGAIESESTTSDK